MESDSGLPQVVHHPADADALDDPAFWALAGVGNSLAEKMRGDHAYSGPSLGFPTFAATGHCRLCGQLKRLSFEHIPPRSAGNRTKRRFTQALEVLKAPDVENFPTKGFVIQQRGSGFYVLCRECNSLLNDRGYVEEYRQFVGGVAQSMVEFVGQHPETEVFPQRVRLEVENLRPGRIVRQALAMVICASGSANLTCLVPTLRECVLDGATRELPLGMSLHLAVAVGPRGRFVPPIVSVDRGAATWQVLTEATFAPLSWVLRVSAWPPTLSLADVSPWTKLDLDIEQTIDVVTEAGFVFGPMPLDYRHSDEFPHTS